jgi:hypothetical protein
MKTSTCRRCTECVGEEHHWSDEYIEFAEDEPDHEACKHCPAWKPYDPDADDGELVCGSCGRDADDPNRQTLAGDVLCEECADDYPEPTNAR